MLKNVFDLPEDLVIMSTTDHIHIAAVFPKESSSGWKA